MSTFELISCKGLISITSAMECVIRPTARVAIMSD